MRSVAFACVLFVGCVVSPEGPTAPLGHDPGALTVAGRDPVAASARAITAVPAKTLAPAIDPTATIAGKKAPIAVAPAPWREGAGEYTARVTASTCSQWKVGNTWKGNGSVSVTGDDAVLYLWRTLAP